MRKYDVKGLDDALAYIVDCTLATVSTMAMKKRRAKYEFERQISIAQTGLNWMEEMGVRISSDNRAFDALKAGGVKEWVKQYIPKGE